MWVKYWNCPYWRIYSTLTALVVVCEQYFILADHFALVSFCPSHQWKDAFQLNLWTCFLTFLSFTLFKGYIKVLVLALNSARGAQVSMPIMLVGVKSLRSWHHLSWFLPMCVLAAWNWLCLSNIDLCALSLDVLKVLYS